MAKNKKKENCLFCGMKDGHTRQCSLPALKQFDGSPEKLEKDRELLKKIYLPNTRRTENE